MADVNSSVWHSDLSCLPIISGKTVDKFIKLHCIASETSVRGYCFSESNMYMILKVISSVSGAVWHCNIYVLALFGMRKTRSLEGHLLYHLP